MTTAHRDKIVIVTGGSRGIGEATVRRFAEDDARVYFTYHRHEEAAMAVATDTGAQAIQCDQTDDQAIQTAVDRVVKEAGRVDVLVNNAGISSDQFLMMMTSEMWHKVIDTNLNGAYRWCKAVSRPMLNARSGCIVNVSSVSGLIGVPGQANYAASKGGLIALTRTLAAEFGVKGIRVNAVVPGFIETDMTARMPRAIKRSSTEAIVLQRFGKPDESAGVITFLASGDASYIAGQTIVVDGGLSATGGIRAR